MTEPERYSRTYRFGPLERRGFAGGLRPGQVLVLGVACLLAVALFRRSPTAGGLFLATLLIGLASLGVWAVVGGRHLDEWALVLGPWVSLTMRSKRRYASAVPTRGTTVDLRTRRMRHTAELPPTLATTQLVALPLADEREVGVFWDRRLDAYTAVLALRVRSFGLLAAADQERRLTRWGRVLASVARDGGAIRRVQLLERTLPHDENQLRRWADSHGELSIPRDTAIRRSYDGLLRAASDVTQDHEVLVAMQIEPRRARTGVPSGASVAERAHGLVLREVRALAERLDGSDAGVVGVCTPEECARLVTLAFEPHRRHEQRSHGIAELVGPTATEVSWDRYRCDGAIHRTYWIAQWPRLGVGPAFLGPLLLTQAAVRAFSVVIEPVPPTRSRNAIEAAITSDEADEQLRRERGFRTTARRHSQQAATERREAELSEGHEELRFAGYITVTGRNDEELERHCEEILQAAQQAYLDLQPMWGQQDTSFVAGALPLCHGLARGGLLW